MGERAALQLPAKDEMRRKEIRTVEWIEVEDNYDMWASALQPQKRCNIKFS